MPNSPSVGIHLRHTILMGYEDMPVGHEHRIADFAATQQVLVAPADLSILHDEHPPLFALSSIEELMSR